MWIRRLLPLWCLTFAIWFLAYDDYSSEPGESHIDGILEVGSLTVDAVRGASPACTVAGNGYMYTTLLAEAYSKSTETAQEVADSTGRSLVGQVIIITGSSNGIGKETARVLMMHGAHVVFAVRNKEKGRAVVKEIWSEHGSATVMTCDLSSLASVRSFADEFKATELPLHQLINNAGIMMTPTYETTADGFELQWGVDHLGHYLLTMLLLPKLQAAGTVESPSRVINLASTAHYTADSLDPIRDLPPRDVQYNSACNYGMAKMSNMLFTRHLQHLTRADAAHHVVAVAVHPGVVHTGLGRENKGFVKLFFESGLVWPMLKTIEQGAATTTYCAMSAEVPRRVAAGVLAYRDIAEWDIHATGMNDTRAADLWKISHNAVKSFLDPIQRVI